MSNKNIINVVEAMQRIAYMAERPNHCHVMTGQEAGQIQLIILACRLEIKRLKEDAFEDVTKVQRNLEELRVRMQRDSNWGPAELTEALQLVNEAFRSL
jgi:hypothetical protein